MLNKTVNSSSFLRHFHGYSQNSRFVVKVPIFYIQENPMPAKGHKSLGVRPFALYLIRSMKNC